MCRKDVTQEPCSVIWLVDQQLGHREGDLPALADEGTAPPGPGVLQGDHARGAAAGAVDARLAAAAAGELPDRGGGLLVGRDDVVDQAQVLGHLQPFGCDVGGDDRPGAQRPAEHGGGQTDRPEAGDQQPVPAGQLQPQETLVGGAEATRDERAVDVGQRFGQEDAGRLVGQQVLGVPAVALPAVRRAQG
jgi:hypothetical protein